MSDEKENEFERDFSEETNGETTLTEESSDNIEETKLTEESSDSIGETTLTEESSDNIEEISQKEIDPIAEANESLITMNSAPFDETLQVMSQTLASIDNKIDIESEQLKQLDQLSEIKEQLNRLENNSLSTEPIETVNEPEILAQTENEESQNNIGHNQQEISELLEKIDILEKKISTMEILSNDFTDKFKNFESVVERFEELENDLEVEYEEDEPKKNLFANLFKKKDVSESYKESKITLNGSKNEPKTSAEELQENSELILREKHIPNDTENIIKQAEKALTSSEELKDQFIVDNTKNNKQKNISYGMFLILLITFIIVYLFDKFKIIKLNEIIINIISLF